MVTKRFGNIPLGRLPLQLAVAPCYTRPGPSDADQARSARLTFNSTTCNCVPLAAGRPPARSDPPPVLSAQLYTAVPAGPFISRTPARLC
jgi:hypothetical protein